MRTSIGFAFAVGVVFAIGLPPKVAEAATKEYVLASGNAGIVQGQTIRLSVANIGPADVYVKCGPHTYPAPITLFEESFTLHPGESRDIDFAATQVPSEHFDHSGRAQVRASCSSDAPTVRANLEVFDNETGKTTFTVSLWDF
jgi:hypothetical protein